MSAPCSQNLSKPYTRYTRLFFLSAKVPALNGEVAPGIDIFRREQQENVYYLLARLS